MQLATEKYWVPVDLISSEEIPSQSLVTVLIIEGNQVEVAIGNEKLMHNMDAHYESESVLIHTKDNLLVWQHDGRSVILPSARLVPKSSSSPLPLPIISKHYSMLGLFGIQDLPWPEASTLVTELQCLNIDIRMISGDNTITAKTVG